jgi:rhodanese-related sulfurtransferase
MAKSSHPQIVDVREDWERTVSGTIEPDVHAPMSQMMRGETQSLTALDPALPTVVYCAVGQRSLAVARFLREQLGFRTALSLRGGIQAWKSSG